MRCKRLACLSNLADCACAMSSAPDWQWGEVAFLGLAAVNTLSGGLGGVVEDFVNHHVVSHGTGTSTATEIMTNGFRQSK